MSTSDTSLEESLWIHLEELRQCLIHVIMIIGLGFLTTCWFYQDVFSFLTHPFHVHEQSISLHVTDVAYKRIRNATSQPMNYTLPINAKVKQTVGEIVEHSQKFFTLLPNEELIIELETFPNKLAILSPTEGFTSVFKFSLWVSIVMTSPLWLLRVMRFIIPGLNFQERQFIPAFLLLSALFLSGGLAFAYLFTIPIANAFFWGFNTDLGQNLWTLEHYLDFTLFLALANGIAFEMALLFFVAVHLEWISSSWMSSHRRHMVVAILIASALLTPPDVISQITLAVPLLGFYELAILYGKVRTGRFRAHTPTQIEII